MIVKESLFPVFISCVLCAYNIIRVRCRTILPVRIQCGFVADLVHIRLHQLPVASVLDLRTLGNDGREICCRIVPAAHAGKQR